MNTDIAIFRSIYTYPHLKFPTENHKFKKQLMEGVKTRLLRQKFQFK